MRLHPIFSVLVGRPDLLADHLAGYAALAREEAASAAGALAGRALAWSLAAAAFIAFLVLAGVAAMVGAVFGQFHWMLVLVPAIALALAGASVLQARRPLPQPVLAQLRAQLDADAQALRAMGATS